MVLLLGTWSSRSRSSFLLVRAIWPDTTARGRTLLSQEHAHEIFTESAVDPAVADQRGYETLPDTPESRDRLAALGFKPFVWDRDDAYPGLLVPMHNAHGEPCGAQYKPAVPRTRVKESNGERVSIKYETPTGAPLVVDVPAFTREHMTNLDLTLWITEGLKKTDALVSQGLPALGLTGVFNWRNKMGSLGDWEDIPLKGRPVALCFDADALVNRNVQLAMTRLGAWLKSRGAGPVHYVVTPGAVEGTETKGVDDFFAAGGTREQLAAAKLESPPGQGAVDAAFTDAFLVEDLVSDALEGRFVWTRGLGWLMWTGSVWKQVADVAPLEAARQWASARFDAVADESKKDKSRNFGPQLSGWRMVLSKNRIGSLVAMARGVAGIEADTEEFDADPDLLTVENGTVHLPTGLLRPHAASDRITKCAPARYVPGYRHPSLSKALEALPEESRPFLKDRLGQAVTGYMTPDHMMVVSHGGGENGKSTLADLMLATIGESDAGGYGVLISDRVLMANPGDHPTELMDLRGARYAVLEETPEARHLNVQRMKSAVGTPRMKARRIRQDPVSWQSTHSLFVNTNHRPVVNETDHGTWRRLALLSYPYTFRKRAADVVDPARDRLGDPRLQYAKDDPAVRQAMLTWLVEGAQEFYARGRMMLEPPARVQTDTLAWRAESDQVVGFATDCLEFDPQAWTSTEDMLKGFNAWLEGMGHRPWNAMTLGNRMGGHAILTEHHVEQARKTVNGRKLRGWAGVRIARSDNPFSP